MGSGRENGAPPVGAVDREPMASQVSFSPDTAAGEPEEPPPEKVRWWCVQTTRRDGIVFADYTGDGMGGEEGVKGLGFMVSVRVYGPFSV